MSCGLRLTILTGPVRIREQMKTAAKQAEADRGQSAPKKNAPDRGDR